MVKSLFYNYLPTFETLLISIPGHTHYCHTILATFVGRIYDSHLYTCKLGALDKKKIFFIYFFYRRLVLSTCLSTWYLPDVNASSSLQKSHAVCRRPQFISGRRVRRFCALKKLRKFEKHSVPRRSLGNARENCGTKCQIRLL